MLERSQKYVRRRIYLLLDSANFIDGMSPMVEEGARKTDWAVARLAVVFHRLALVHSTVVLTVHSAAACRRSSGEQLQQSVILGEFRCLMIAAARLTQLHAAFDTHHLHIATVELFSITVYPPYTRRSNQ